MIRGPCAEMITFTPGMRASSCETLPRRHSFQKHSLLRFVSPKVLTEWRSICGKKLRAQRGEQIVTLHSSCVFPIVPPYCGYPLAILLSNCMYLASVASDICSSKCAIAREKSQSKSLPTGSDTVRWNSFRKRTIFLHPRRYEDLCLLTSEVAARQWRDLMCILTNTKRW